MLMSKEEFTYWLEEEICASVSEDVELTPGMVEHYYGVVIDNFREQYEGFEIDFPADDAYFLSIVELFEQEGK